MMKTEVTSRELAKLLGLTSSAIAELSKRTIIISGSERGTYRLQESIRNYVEHLRRLPAEQESEHTVKQPTIEQKKQVAAQADFAEGTAERMSVDMVASFDDAELPRTHIRFLTKRVRSFRIYIREGRCYTIWDK